MRGISSMATRQLLAELAGAWRARSGVEVGFESVGGVDAAKRVQAGEAFDLSVLAADAIDKLVAGGACSPAAASTWCARPWRSPCAQARRGPTCLFRRSAARAVLARAASAIPPARAARPCSSCSSAGAFADELRAASCRRRPACRWANWWPTARSSSASSSQRNAAVPGIACRQRCRPAARSSPSFRRPLRRLDPPRGRARAARLHAFARHRGGQTPPRHGTGDELEKS
jgi:hypothetical protein